MPQPLQYAPRAAPPRFDVHLVIASSILLLLLSSLLITSISRLIERADERLTSGGKLFGTVAVAGLLCQGLSLFARSRTVTGIIFYGASGTALATIGAVIFGHAEIGIRLIMILASFMFAYVAWAYSRWGRRLAAWKWARDRSAVLPVLDR